jgi:hypothetical protein
LVVSILAPNAIYAQVVPTSAPAREADLIVVTGIRGALEQAAALKRNADQVSDVRALPCYYGSSAPQDFRVGNVKGRDARSGAAG